MLQWLTKRRSRPVGFLARLARDRGGNALAIMAAALIPLAGMVGGGLDLSRMYIVKTRLQHACDAGTLAGRKAMGGGTWSQSSFMPRTQAERFFDANISTSPYGASNVTRSFSEQAGKVTGSASAIVPMTLMRIFGRTTETLNVVCDAEMRLPNTDVMFVLDVTGSMNCAAGDTRCSNNGGIPAANSKIDGLKTAVKCFYEIVARLDTDANCIAGSPSGGTGDAVQIRFGFVPYSSAVNIGKQLPIAWMANSASYQSRVRNGWTWGDWYYYFGTTTGTYGAPRGECAPAYANTDTRQFRLERSNNNCNYYARDRIPEWRYGAITHNVSALKGGNPYLDRFALAIANGGGDKDIGWEGCVEETPSTNINARPSGGFAPLLPDAVYMRRATNNSTRNLDRSDVTTTENYVTTDLSACPSESRPLQEWKTAEGFENYVNGLIATGGTYHDLGMLWGGRLVSPSGLYGATNAFTAQGGEIERHLIFMTDGDASAWPCEYSGWGVPFFDRRMTTDVGNATDCRGPRDALANSINSRLETLCTAVKNESVTLWVISYGGGVNTDTEARLERCASDGKYFTADDPDQLQRRFKQIADQISQLRLTR